MLPTSTRIDDGRASRVLYRAGRSQDRSKHHLRRMGHEAIQGSATRHSIDPQAGDTSAAESPSDVRCMRTNPVIGLRSCSMGARKVGCPTVDSRAEPVTSRAAKAGHGS